MILYGKWLFAAGFLFLCGALQGAPATWLTQPLRCDLQAPDFVSETNDWINTSGRKLAFEAGHVYLVHFWTFGCINCKRNLPAYQRWQKRYQTLTIIGVHTPETEPERKAENVQDQVRKLGITYPVLMDQKSANWKKWRQQVWPTVYLVDQRGHVRYQWVGELEWQNAGGEALMTRCVEALLAEAEKTQLSSNRVTTAKKPNTTD